MYGKQYAPRKRAVVKSGGRSAAYKAGYQAALDALRERGRRGGGGGEYGGRGGGYGARRGQGRRGYELDRSSSEGNYEPDMFGSRIGHRW